MCALNGIRSPYHVATNYLGLDSVYRPQGVRFVHIAPKCTDTLCSCVAKAFIELVKYLFTVEGVTVIEYARTPWRIFLAGRDREEERMRTLCIRVFDQHPVINTTCANVHGDCRGARKRMTFDISNEP